MNYYYALNNDPFGPIPLEQLHELYRSGTITPETLVVAEGGTEWKPYSTLNAAPRATPAAAVATQPNEQLSGAATPAAASAAPFSAASIPPSGSPTFTPTTVPAPGYKNLVLISWILLGGTALLSVIPVLGCLSWVMFVPVFLTTVILGFITLSRGGTRDGVLILIASIVVLPVFTLFAPIVTTALFGAVTGVGDKIEAIDAEPDPSVPPAPSAQPSRAVREEPTAAPAITRPPAETSSVSRAGNVPDATAAKQMVNNTMLNFKNAVNAGDFEPFYRTQLSDRWKQEITPEKLKAIFAAFVEKKIDLSPIFFVDPVMEAPPSIDEDGLLILKGGYPVEKEKVNVTYELAYSREAKWALSGINVKIHPLEE
jgi:hypothetical protein